MPNHTYLIYQLSKRKRFIIIQDHILIVIHLSKLQYLEYTCFYHKTTLDTMSLSSLSFILYVSGAVSVSLCDNFFGFTQLFSVIYQ